MGWARRRCRAGGGVLSSNPRVRATERGRLAQAEGGRTRACVPLCCVRAQVRVELPRRGLQVLAGDARYNWTHRIDHADLLDPRRISITFRMSHNDVGKNKARK